MKSFRQRFYLNVLLNFPSLQRRVAFFIKATLSQRGLRTDRLPGARRQGYLHTQIKLYIEAEILCGSVILAPWLLKR